jgi:hypothetical protein
MKEIVTWFRTLYNGYEPDNTLKLTGELTPDGSKYVVFEIWGRLVFRDGGFIVSIDRTESGQFLWRKDDITGTASSFMDAWENLPPCVKNPDDYDESSIVYHASSGAKKLPTKNQQLMFSVKISVPTYKANSWGQLDKQGEVQISADVDSLSQEYPVMKAQIDELLREASAENRLALDLTALEPKCEHKQKSLNILEDKINVARQQLRPMEAFLKRLGIDPTSYRLIIDEKVALREATTADSGEVVAVEAEVDPIPFDLGTDEPSYEF